MASFEGFFSPLVKTGLIEAYGAAHGSDEQPGVGQLYATGKSHTVRVFEENAGLTQPAGAAAGTATTVLSLLSSAARAAAGAAHSSAQYAADAGVIPPIVTAFTARTVASARVSQAQTRKGAEINALSEKIATNFIHHLIPLAAASLTLSTLRYHITSPFSKEPNKDPRSGRSQLDVAITSIKKNIVLISAANRLASLGLAIASLALSVTYLAISVLSGLAALIVELGNLLFLSHETRARDFFVVQSSQALAMTALFIAHVIGIFHLDTRDGLVLELGNAFSDRKAINETIDALYLVKTPSAAPRRR